MTKKEKQHEQLLTSIENWLPSHGTGTTEHIGEGPRLFEVMAEFDLSIEEATAALQEVGKRLRARRDR